MRMIFLLMSNSKLPRVREKLNVNFASILDISETHIGSEMIGRTDRSQSKVLMRSYYRAAHAPNNTQGLSRLNICRAKCFH